MTMTNKTTILMFWMKVSLTMDLYRI